MSKNTEPLKPLNMPEEWCCAWCHIACEVCDAPFENNGVGGAIPHRHRSVTYQRAKIAMTRRRAKAREARTSE